MGMGCIKQDRPCSSCSCSTGTPAIPSWFSGCSLAGHGWRWEMLYKMMHEKKRSSSCCEGLKRIPAGTTPASSSSRSIPVPHTSIPEGPVPILSIRIAGSSALAFDTFLSASFFSVLSMAIALPSEPPCQDYLEGFLPACELEPSCCLMELCQ